MKKPKRVKSEIAPIYGATKGAPLNLDILNLAAAGSHMQRLFLWLDIVQRKIAKTEPRNDEARKFAEDCRALIPQIVWYSVFPTATMEDTCEAMSAAIELEFAVHAFAVSNELGDLVRSGRMRRDAGKKLAAKQHSPAKAQTVLRKWTKVQKRCSELIGAGVIKPKVLKTLNREFDVKPSTLEKKLRTSGHLPRVKRNSAS